MEKIEWTKEIATGITEIDAQHKVFLKLCSDIAAAAEKGAKATAITAGLKKLEEFAPVHFATEGKIMAETMYPDEKGHFKLHGIFLDELKKVKSRAAAGETGADFAEEIKERLADWFVIHIKKSDIKMASYIKTI